MVGSSEFEQEDLPNSVSQCLNLHGCEQVGVGGAALGEFKVQGRWSSQEFSQSSNSKELATVGLAFKHFLPHIRNQAMCIQTDNQVTRSYLVHQGEYNIIYISFTGRLVYGQSRMFSL